MDPDKFIRENAGCWAEAEEAEIAILSEDGAGWEIYGSQQPIEIVLRNTRTNEEFAFALQVKDVNFVVDFAAGLSFSSVRDQRYRLDTAPQPTPTATTPDKTLTRVSDAGIPYSVAAFVHYLYVGDNDLWFIPLKNFGFAFGLGTLVPSNGLSVNLGLSYKLATISSSNSGYLSVGLSYSPHQVLRAAYEGLNTVPASTDSSTLLETKYDLGLFVGLSFGFFGGEEKLKAVYEGKPPR